MTSETSDDAIWVTFRLNNQLYALPADRIGEMLLLPATLPVPTQPAWIRGVTRVREDVVLVAEARTQFGLQAIKEETRALVELLSAREQDHRNWLDELERSMREGTRFALATDPHQCGFGKWYDNYRTDNLLLAAHLKRFDEPHKAIHALAARTLGMVREGQREQALSVIQQAREGVLHEMIQLFGTAKHLIEQSTREILIVLRGASPKAGLCVDAIARVGVIDSIQPIAQSPAGGGVINNVAQVGEDVVMLVDDAFLASSFASIGVAFDIQSAA
ncbi:MAG: chemotaxis protein CheW [Polyangiaceae bacterium]